MSKTGCIISHEGIEYLCGLIRDLSNVSEGIDDLNIRSDGTFSSLKLNTLLRTLKEDCNEYSENLCSNLSRLELKLVTNENNITQSNILYLFKPDGQESYNQYVVIDGNKVLLGTCDVSMTDYYTITQADNRFALQTSLDTTNTEVTNIKTNIGVLNDLPTTDKTSIVNAIKEVFQSVSNGKSLIASAITDKGVDTSNTDTFTTMAENILNIVGGSGDLTDIYNALQYHNLIVNGRETSELIGNYIKALLIPRTLTEETTNVTLFTDLIDDTIHDIEIEENANGTVLVCDNNLNGTVSDGYKEFESINKSDFVTNISFV